jgi:hypothetical protein
MTMEALMKLIKTILFLVLAVNLFSSEEITVYSNNIAYVKTQMDVNLVSGFQDVLFTDFPEQIDYNSLVISSNGSKFRVHSQINNIYNSTEYFYQLCEKSINKNVEIGLKENKSIMGRLISYTRFRI